jgi:hypothetical protein
MTKRRTRDHITLAVTARDHITHKIAWVDSGREPQCAPNPLFPDGKDIPSPRHGEPGFRFCRVALPYPAKRCGAYIIRCEACGNTYAVTTAGRADDPRSVEMECGG